VLLNKNETMKNIITLLLLIISLNLFAQTNKIKNVDFFGKSIEVLDECGEVMQGMLKCDSFILFWISQPLEDFERHKDEFMVQMSEREAEKIECYILDKKVDAYKGNMEEEGTGSGYSLNICSKINNQVAFITMWLKTNPQTNDELPNFIKQILKF
jgi:hypothetical protein